MVGSHGFRERERGVGAPHPIFSVLELERESLSTLFSYPYRGRAQSVYGGRVPVLVENQTRCRPDWLCALRQMSQLVQASVCLSVKWDSSFHLNSGL